MSQAKYYDLLPRSIVSVFVVIYILAGIRYPEAHPFIFGFILFLMLIEFARFRKGGNNKRDQIYLAAAGTILFALCYLLELYSWFDPLIPASALIGFNILLIWKLLKKESILSSEASHRFLGIVYLVIPFSLIEVLIPSDLEFLERPMLWMMACIWANDAGAFMLGRYFGRRKLIPEISPKKTVEGFVGGVICAILMMALTQSLHHWDALQYIVFAVLIAITATAGDIFESSLKRRANVKDSGHWLGPHGGFLDRFDSTIFCIPLTVVFSVITMLKNL